MSYEHVNDDPTETGAANPSGQTATEARPAMPPPPAAPAAAPSGSGGTGPLGRILAVVTVAGLAVVGIVLAAMTLVAAVAIGAFIGIAVGNAEEITHTPTSVDEIPTSIVSDEADVVIDLTALSVADFAGRTEPFALDVDIELGSVRVIVPDDLAVTVDADTDVGSTNVFDRTDDGFANRVVVDAAADADLDLTIDVGLGDIDVDRDRS